MQVASKSHLQEKHGISIDDLGILDIIYQKLEIRKEKYEKINP
jgi:hypothetical protein